MFILENLSKIIINYPKYLILLKLSYMKINILLDYVIAKDILSYRITKIGISTLNYLISPCFIFNIALGNEKFNLSKLGTDYLVNKLGVHFKSECTGSYPDNYIFVNEPIWPVVKYIRTDITHLKRNCLLGNKFKG